MVHPLRLPDEDRECTNVEVDEVFGFWTKKGVNRVQINEMRYIPWVTYEPKFLPTTTCQVGPYFRSNSFLMNAAISFSILYFSRACVATSTLACCTSSLISTLFMIAFGAPE